EEDYALRIFLEQKDADGVTRVIEIGQLSSSVRGDLWKLSNRIDSDGRLKPGESIPHLYLIAVATVGVAEDQRSAVKPPFRQSGMALAPVIKGFPMIHFFFRKRGWFSR